MISRILESLLLIINAIAILNEKRFLKMCTPRLHRKRIRHPVSTTQQPQPSGDLQVSNHHDGLLDPGHWQV